MNRIIKKLSKIFNDSPATLSREGVICIPEHVAIIMDGNGRWATARKLPRQLGHRAGAKNLKEIVRAAGQLGIKYLTVYAFSTENWQRPKNEVNALMQLFVDFFLTYDAELALNDVRLRFAGDIDCLPPEVKKTINTAETNSSGRHGLQLIIAFNYGGRRELLRAFQKLAATGIPFDSLNESDISGALYLPDVPDPEMIIRTGGEMRLSNFLLWQSAYAELFSSPKLWPEFTEKDLIQIISAYNKRDRKFGGITSENQNHHG